jgi:CRP-like cAMP-binding protein
MEQVEIIQNFKKHVDLSKEEIALLMQSLQLKKLKKNRYLITQDQDVSPLILIKSGCLMTYFTDGQQIQHVLQFGAAMWWTGDLNSFTNGHPSSYSIKAMEDSEIYAFSKKQFEELCQKIPVLDRYFRIIFQNSLVSHQKRIIRNISFTAEQKYLTFQQMFPGMELIIPAKYIASYLGITPEFLSKLRRRLSGK